MAAFAAGYARALSEALTAANADVSAAQQKLQDFSGTFSGSNELREVLANPGVPHEQKLRVIDAIAVRLELPRQIRNLVAVLMDHNRLAALDEVMAEFKAVTDRQQGIMEAQVTTAHDLGESERHSLEEKIALLAGSRVRASYKQDPALLGGAVVRIGSTVYDGSVRGQLDSLKRELVAI